MVLQFGCDVLQCLSQGTGGFCFFFRGFSPRPSGETEQHVQESQRGAQNIHSLDGTQNRLLDPQLRKGATSWIDGAEVSDVLRLKAQDRPQLQAE